MKLTDKNKKLTNENEQLNYKINELTEEKNLLKQKDAMRENQFESFNEYIKLLESKLNNQRNN